MKAMILAAGHGTRMRPLTDHTPKPLLKVGDKPLIVWHIEKLKQAGFQDIVINIAWLGYQIPEALGDGSKFGVSLHYSDEQNEGALETAGGIIKALPLLTEGADTPFLVINGDVWCDYSLSNQSPLAIEKTAHIILVKNPPHNPDGDFSLDGKIVSQAEQDNVGAVANTTRRASKTRGGVLYTFSGIGYYRPSFFQDLPQGKRPLAPLLRKAMEKNKVTGELFTEDWRDIGTPERLAELDTYLNLLRREHKHVSY